MVNSGVTASLSNLTIQHGNAEARGFGGGIYNKRHADRDEQHPHRQ